jgi:hypothetical protein
MTPEQWRHITAVFHQALHHERPDRLAFLDDACQDNAALRREVDRLLAAHDAASGFGQTPAPLAGEEAAAPRPRDPFLMIVWLCAAITVAAFSYGAGRLVTAPGGRAALSWMERSQAGAGM